MRSHPLLTWGSTILLSGMAATAAHGLPPEREALARAAVVAYGANMRAFPFYSCRYRYTKAQARTVEDAIAGKLLNAQSYDSRLLVDGDKIFYQGLAPPELPDPKLATPIPGKPGMSRVEVFVNFDSYLADDKREICYSPPMKVASLWDNAKATLGLEADPLGQVGHPPKKGSWGPEFYLAQNDLYELKSVDLEEIDGQPVITVRFDTRKVLQFDPPLRIAESFCFDGAKGHLPIRLTTLWNDKPQSRRFVTHFRECSNQRWFPERVVVVDTPGKGVTLFTVFELQVLELDADHRPDARDFAFTMKAGTEVNEGASNDATRCFLLKQDEKVRVEDLPTLFAMLDKAKASPLMDTAVAVHRPSQWLRWLGIAAGLALALGGAAYLVRRRKLRAG